MDVDVLVCGAGVCEDKVLAMCGVEHVMTMMTVNVVCDLLISIFFE